MEAIQHMNESRDIDFIEAMRVADPDSTERWSIDNDKKAEWALCAMRSHIQEGDRMIAACDEQISFYKQRKEEIRAAVERKTAYLTSLLQLYFGTVPHKATKTQETYALPSGKLKMKLPTQSIDHDDNVLMERYPDFVQVKPSLAWGELKKRLTIQGGVVIDKTTGEIVDGATAVETPAKFSVEV